MGDLVQLRAGSGLGARAELEAIEDSSSSLDELEIARRAFGDMDAQAKARVRSAVMLLRLRGDVVLADSTDDGSLIWAAATWEAA